MLKFKTNTSAQQDKLLTSNLVVGCILSIIGLLSPAIITVDNIGFFDSLRDAVLLNEKTHLIFAALKLISLNVIRDIPIYLGSFFLAESFVIVVDKKLVMFHRFIIVLLSNMLCYFLIDIMYSIEYYFGLPAFAFIIFLILLGDLRLIDTWKKVTMAITLLTALWSMSVMPLLSSILIGQGELAQEVKHISRFLNADIALNFFTFLLCGLFLFVTLLLWLLIRDENKMILLIEQRKKDAKLLHEAKLDLMESRMHSEVQHLVHDLKSPLVSAQVLISAVSIKLAENGLTPEVEHLQSAENSIERMSGMITDILYDEHFIIVSVEELLRSIMSQISAMDYASFVKLNPLEDDNEVLVNKVRFIRAIINLVENAYYAIDKIVGTITIDVVHDKENNHIDFLVSDNGKGIPPHELSLVWDDGYSSHESHGFGLSFVRNTIEKFGGTVTLSSNPGEGTTACVRLPIEY